MHPFFYEVKSYPDIENVCRTDLVILPEKYVGKEKIKAILIGADPTNNGLRSSGLIELDYVFGINSVYENIFFKIQNTNLEAISLSKENCYIQNLCRNYFTLQTTYNKYWYVTADIWKKYLKEELLALNPSIPILATSNEVFTCLTGEKKPFIRIYKLEKEPIFYSEYLGRTVLALFRGIAYILYKDNWSEYRKYLTTYFKKL